MLRQLFDEAQSFFRYGTIGVALSYVLNRCDLPKFLATYAAVLVSTVVAVTVMLRRLSPELAQLVDIVVTPIVIYTSLPLLRFWQQEVQLNAA